MSAKTICAPSAKLRAERLAQRIDFLGIGDAEGTAPIRANQLLALANPKIRSQYIPIAYFAVGELNDRY
jgi:hypothetical protein